MFLFDNSGKLLILKLIYNMLALEAIILIFLNGNAGVAINFFQMKVFLS